MSIWKWVSSLKNKDKLRLSLFELGKALISYKDTRFEIYRLHIKHSIKGNEIDSTEEQALNDEVSEKLKNLENLLIRYAFSVSKNNLNDIDDLDYQDHSEAILAASSAIQKSFMRDPDIDHLMKLGLKEGVSNFVSHGNMVWSFFLEDFQLNTDWDLVNDELFNYKSHNDYINFDDTYDKQYLNRLKIGWGVNSEAGHLLNKGIEVSSINNGQYQTDANVDFRKLEYERKKLTRSIKKYSKWF